MRTRDQHDGLIQEIQDDGIEEDYGVKDSCVLSDHLSFFHHITGFPLNIFHVLFEGVVPVELAHCLKGMVTKKYFPLEELKSQLSHFPSIILVRLINPHLISQNLTT